MHAPRDVDLRSGRLSEHRPFPLAKLCVQSVVNCFVEPLRRPGRRLCFANRTTG